MRDSFDQDIAVLRDDTLHMLEKVSSLLDKAITSLIEQDQEMARQVYKMDDIIDDMMDVIEDKAIELMALQAPAAKDLRIMVAIIKMVSDIERMGDYCVNIAREVIMIGNEPILLSVTDIKKMRDVIQQMIAATKSCLVNEDVQLAFEITEEDDIIDDMFKDFYNNVMLKIHENQSFINQGNKLLFVGRYLERIADHLTNVAEDIIYIKSGTMVETNNG